MRPGFFAHPVSRLRTVMPRQRFERPVGIRHHSNVAFGADEDGHLRTRLPVPRRRFGGVQDVAGLFGQMHTFISQSPARILVVNSLTFYCQILDFQAPSITPIFSNLTIGADLLILLA